MACKWVPILSIVTALTIVGWGDTRRQSAWAANDTNDVVESQADKGKSSGATLDDRLAEVGKQVSGFGGMFIDAAGRLNIDLLDPGQEKDALAAITAVFGSEHIPPGGVRILQGQYSFLQLKDWHERMMPEVLGLEGVVLTDYDELTNRLRVGVEAQKREGGVEVQQLKSGVEVQLARLGIPSEAVIIEEMEAIELVSHTLRSRVRPLVGGLQINFSNFLCSLGFIATRPNNVQGMVTNSHCTNIQGGVQNTVYHQPLASGTTNRIGVEISDPNYFTGGVCPAGRRCRFSDSAFVRVPHPSGPSVTVSRGFIARPTSVPNTGALTINHNAPTFRIVSEASSTVLGVTLNKVGRTTGWTQGVVVATCVNTNVSGTNITQLCQNFVNAGVGGGDSGSPVFRILNSPASGDVRLHGILWGGNSSGTLFVYSPIGASNIQRATELGPLTTCAPGFAC